MAITVIRSKPKSQTQIAFERFHAANPHVYDLLEQATRHLWEDGRRRIGARAIVEELRWGGRVLSTTDPHFKLNDKYTPRYARLLIANHPEWEGLFELRALKEER